MRAGIRIEGKIDRNLSSGVSSAGKKRRKRGKELIAAVGACTFVRIGIV
jgi:hypothetical protein